MIWPIKAVGFALSHLRGQNGCMCGAVRYEYTGELGPTSYCNCDDFRRATGGPYTVGVRAKQDQLHCTAEQPKEYIAEADSGEKITRTFCPECGSPLTKAEAAPGKRILKGPPCCSC